MEKKTCGNCRFADLYAYQDPCRACLDAGHGSKWEQKPTEAENPYWKRIEALAERQRAKGISKYGYGLESNPMSIISRLEYLEEELIDALFYIEHIKEFLSDGR